MIVKRFTLREKLIIAFILLLTSTGHTRTWYVKPDQTGDAPTIQAAIDSSGTGDTVLVAPGTYTQSMIDFWDANTLSIIGEEGAENTIMHVTDLPYHLSVGNCDSLILKGFTFENSEMGGVSFYWCSRVSVKENIFRFNDGAISLDMCSDVAIVNNLIYSNGGGIGDIEVGGSYTISNNTIVGNELCGISLCTSGVWHHITNNIVTGSEYGIVVSDYNFVTCNNVYDNDINYQSITDPTGTDGNISVDSQFCAVKPDSTGNFLLQSDSPCLPGNHPDGYDCGLIGALSVGCGPTRILDEIPSANILYQNFPNPFNPVTTIRYYLPEEAQVALEIYDMSGRLVARLADEYKEKGIHFIEWKGLDERGNPLASGIYLYQLRAGNEKISRKMVLLR